MTAVAWNVTNCLQCNRETNRPARGLCRRCYASASRTGTLKQWPLEVNRDRGDGEPEGPTYRQLDYWVRVGYLRPAHAEPGSGGWRYWSAEECRVANLMARLVTVGFTPRLAHDVARSNGRLQIEGVAIEVTA